MADDNYVTRLALAKCSMGTMTNYINLKNDHGIYFNDVDHPLINANDHLPDENVIHFGRCNSGQNAGNKFDVGKVLLDSLIPGSSMIRNLMGCGGCKCKPMTFQPWVNDKSDHLIEGAPAVTEGSQLVCYYGGIINILPEDEAKKDEAEYIKEERIGYE